MKMKMSEEGLDFLTDLEGVRRYPYSDKTGKEITEWQEGATIGVGHLISKYEWDIHKSVYLRALTDGQIEDLLLHDVYNFELVINEEMQYYEFHNGWQDGRKKILQNRFDALVCLAFNIGVNAFKNSSVNSYLKGESSNYATLEDSWKAWNKIMADGKLRVSKGLCNRREAEWHLFAHGVY